MVLIVAVIQLRTLLANDNLCLVVLNDTEQTDIDIKRKFLLEAFYSKEVYIFTV